MMERVQIQGGSNGVYIDAKGRHLRTMGDFAPSPGQWVYTNGVTIYGHMTRGDTPLVINYTDGPVLPFMASFYPPNSNYNDTGDQCVEVTKKCDFEKFITYPKLYTKPQAYVGNGYNAYIGTPDYSGQRTTYKWYRLSDGKYLGTFSPEDACVGDDGSLLTIELPVHGYQHSYEVTGGEDWHLLGGSKVVQYGGAAYEENAKTVEVSLYVSDGEKDKRPSQDDKIKYDEKIIIRKNGIVIKEISLKEYAEQAAIKLKPETAKLHYSGKCLQDWTYWHYFKIPDPEWGNKTDAEKVNRPQPPYTLNSAYASAYALKIYPNGDYSGFVMAGASGYAYPYVTTTTQPMYCATSAAEKESYEKGRQNKTDQIMMGYPPFIEEEVVVGTPKLKKSHWRACNTSISCTYGIGKISKKYFEGISASFESATAAPGVYSFNEGDGGIRYEPKPVIPGYGFMAALIIMPYTTNERQTMYLYTSSDNANLFGVNKYIKKVISDAFVKDCTSSCTITQSGEPLPLEYDLRGGYKIRLKLRDRQQIYSYTGFDIIGPNGELVVLVDGPKGVNTSLMMACYYWNKISVCKLDEGVYLLTLNNGYYCYVIKNGQAMHPESLYGFSNLNYTLIKFRSKNKLKRQMQIWYKKRLDE